MTELERKINNLVEDYQENLILAKSIGFPEAAYEGTTATAEDIAIGKTAYSNGKFITGTSENINNNALLVPGTALNNMLKVITQLDLSGMTSTAYLFKDCNRLESLPNLNTATVTNMSNMFNNCASLKQVPEMNTSNVTNMEYLFATCKSLQTIPNLNLSNVTNMNGIFYNCEGLTYIPDLNTANGITMSRMFFGCKNLKKVPNIDTSKATSIGMMFQGCESITSIPLLNTSTVVGFSSLCENCFNLVNVPILDTSSATGANMQMMFDGCYKLSNESLNNILAMCIAAVQITNAKYKTLKYIGLTSAQATICTTLPNYQAFLDAGWTTGY